MVFEPKMMLLNEISTVKFIPNETVAIAHEKKFFYKILFYHFV